MKNIFLIIVFFFSISFYGQNDTLAIIRHTDNDFVVPKNKKIIFRGVKNEITIDVPNCKSFKAFGNGLNLVSNNLYTFNPGSGFETTISIEIVLKNNKKTIEKHVFQIRNIKSPITCFNYNKGDTIVRAQKNQFKNAVIRVISADKNFGLDFKITQFNIKIPGQNSIEILGDKIDDKTFDKINRYATKFDEIVISDIHFQTKPVFLGCILVNPMVIKIY